MVFHPKLLRAIVFGLGIVALAAGLVRALGRGTAWEVDPRVGLVRPASLQALPADIFDGGVAWINSAPIKMRDLKGKIVVLDFWTYCCINCHHVLPDLAKLEEKYKNQLVVIGVHTPKFIAERDTENVRRKVREYGIKHPVVCDSDQVIWTRLGVNSWPTLGVIDPDGNVAFAASGEGHLAELDRVIGALVERHRAKGDLNESPVKFFPEVEKPDTTPLLFPGKVVADAAGNRLFISDTGHNRLVMTDLSGKHPVVIGAGPAGLVDGAFEKAEFHRPQGMTLVGDTLFVADTENHAIRAVDLKARTVATVAGTGEQAQGGARSRAAAPGRKTPLNSPWDLAHTPGSRVLYIAMAGPHQIWHMDLETDLIGPWAGTGREDIIDGPVGSAAFAQPSGLATDGPHLFVADSEVSAVRSITLGVGKHVVHSIVGEGLFEFGDEDGVGTKVRLQHCLGLAYGGGKLYIADTYNNKVKVCDPKTRSVRSFVGTGKAGESDKPAEFYQPGGLSLAGSRLYVADTNNNKVRVIDLADESVSTVEIADLRPPATRPRKPSFPNAELHKTAATVGPGTELTLDVTLPIPEGYKLNEEGSMPVLVETPGEPGSIAPADANGTRVEPPARQFVLPVRFARPLREQESIELKVSVGALICSEGSKLCRIKSYVWTVPVTVAKDGKAEIVLRTGDGAAGKPGG